MPSSRSSIAARESTSGVGDVTGPTAVPDAGGPAGARWSSSTSTVPLLTRSSYRSAAAGSVGCPAVVREDRQRRRPVQAQPERARADLRQGGRTAWPVQPDAGHPAADVDPHDPLRARQHDVDAGGAAVDLEVVEVEARQEEPRVGGGAAHPHRPAVPRVEVDLRPAAAAGSSDDHRRALDHHRRVALGAGDRRGHGACGGAGSERHPERGRVDEHRGVADELRPVALGGIVPQPGDDDAREEHRDGAARLLGMRDPLPRGPRGGGATTGDASRAPRVSMSRAAKSRRASSVASRLAHTAGTLTRQGVPASRQLDRREDGGRDEREQRPAIADVPVERRGLDAEAVGDGPHREAIQPVRLEGLEAGRDEPFQAQAARSSACCPTANAPAAVPLRLGLTV